MTNQHISPEAAAIFNFNIIMDYETFGDTPEGCEPACFEPAIYGCPCCISDIGESIERKYDFGFSPADYRAYFEMAYNNPA